MSASQRVRARARRAFPPLVSGQRLDQPAFHERYEAMPPSTRAELVGGTVHLPSPVRHDHGEVDDHVSFWVGLYKRSMKGLRSGKNATVVLDALGEVQPDGHLRLPEEWGGRARIERGFIVGAPELVIEIARSSRHFDLGAKQSDYERSGVPEYLVIELDPNRIHWFVRRGGPFEVLAPGPDGIDRSSVFPGLWLDAGALFAGDLDRVANALEQGLATPEHVEFQSRMGRPRP